MPKRGRSPYSCDTCGSQTAPIRRLSTGGGSGVYCCRRHWGTEMAWRRERNKTLTGKARFPILKFPS